MSAHWLSLRDCVDPAWWYPLEELASRAEREPGLPPVDPDDYLYAARITRPGLPGLNVYRHVLTRRSLNVDDDGGLWRYAGGSAEPAGGYASVGLEEALDRAELERSELLAARTRRGRRRPATPDGDDTGPAGDDTGDRSPAALRPVHTAVGT